MKKDIIEEYKENEIHITLFSFQINTFHPNSNIFKEQEFRNAIKQSYEKFRK